MKAGAERSAESRFVSGRWRGYYEQIGRRFPQRQTMEFADGMLRGEGRDDLGPFRIEGQCRGDGTDVRVGWIKTYEGAHSVLYLGAFDGAWIRGRWEVQGGQGDAFAFAPESVASAEGLP